jgi:hypothetical protein
MVTSQCRAHGRRVIMTCCRNTTTCAATVHKGYITAGQYSPSAYQQELTLHRQHDLLYACQRQHTLCQQDGTRPYPDRGYTQRPTRKISGSKAFKAPICTLFNISPGPPVGTSLSVRTPLMPIKGRACMLEVDSCTHTQRFSLTQGQEFLPQTYKQYITQWT